MATVHDPKFIAEQMALTNPDYVMFVPKRVESESDNVHLYVVEHEQYGGLLAFWTQSTVENTGNNHLVMAGSRDGGKTWDMDYILHTDAPSGDLGYPASVELSDGSIFTVYYQKPAADEPCTLMYTRWTLPD